MLGSVAFILWATGYLAIIARYIYAIEIVVFIETTDGNIAATGPGKAVLVGSAVEKTPATGNVPIRVDFRAVPPTKIG
jgi:hypothetical protein